MENKNSLHFYLPLLLAGLGNIHAAQPVKQHQALSTIENNHQQTNQEILASSKLNTSKIKDKLVSRAFKSHHVDLKADLYTDLICGKGLELHSDRIFDSYLFSLVKFDVGFLAKQYNTTEESKYELKAMVRTKNITGNTGNFSLLERQPVKIGLGRTEHELSFAPQYLMAWFRELSLQYNISTHLNSKIKVGYFPHQIGHGIALGNAHKVGRIVAGLNQQHDVDQYRLGLQLSGDFSPNKLGYSFYGGLIDRKSSNIYDTGQITQGQNTLKRDAPYRGEFTNNMLASAEFYFKPTTKNSDVELKSYFVLNRDDEQQVEYLGDARSVLGIKGFELNITKSNLTLHFEAAMNLGFQDVKSWDRDIVYVASKPYHLYLFQDFGEPGRAKWRTAARTTYPEDLSFDMRNGEVFKDTLDTSIRYKNAYNRFRSSYRNTYEGFFITCDASYEYIHNEEASSTIGACAGFVSGDDHPNDTTEWLLANRLNGICNDPCYGCFQNCEPNFRTKDYDKTYGGFVGIEQLYSGKAVKSFFMMDVHKLNTPLSAKESMITYPQINNLAFLGGGLTYKQRAFDRIFDVSVNGFMFYTPYKEKKGYNYGLDTFFRLNACGEQETNRLIPTLDARGSWELSRFLGCELNGSIYLQFDPNMKLYAQAAIFMPGTYYDDAEGKFIRLSEQFRMASKDYSGYELAPQKYRYELGKSAAVFANIGFEYHFST